MLLIAVIGITTIKIDASASNTATTLATPQFTLTNTANGVTVNWNFVDNATGYIVYRREPSGTYQKVAGFTDGKTKSYTDKTVVNGKKYYYAVKAINSKTQSKYDNKLITYASTLTTPQFTLTNAGNGIKISWNFVNNAAGYIVYRREGSSAFKKVAGFTDGVTQSYVDTTAVNGKTYSYAVKAINGTVQSTYVSKSIAFVKNLATPQFTLTNTISGVRVDWNFVNNATGYIVYRRVEGGVFQKVAGFTDGKTKSYVDTKAVNGTKYYYAVKAINASTQSTYLSKEIVYKKSLATPQFTLTGINSGVRIDWDLVSGASGYIVYRREGNEAFKKVAGFTDGVTKSYVDKTAVNGKKYAYAVKAINGNVQSTYTSKEISYLVSLATPQFSIEQVDTGVKVCWNQVDNATGYIIYRREKNTVFKKIAGFTDGKTTSYVDTNVVSGTQYYYAVKAINGSVQSTYTSKTITYEQKLECTLTVWVDANKQYDEITWLNKQCEAFAAEHPEWDITFEFNKYYFDEMTDNLINGTDYADVFYLSPDNIDLLMENNLLLELDEKATGFVNENYAQTYINCVSKDGKIYGIPYGVWTWFMYYNKNIYTEEDVKSLDTMLEKGTVMFPLANSWYNGAFYLATGAEFFGGNNDNNAGINIGGVNGVKTTNYLVDLASNPNFLDGEFYYATDGLKNGSIAAAFSGPWDQVNAKEALGENYAVAALPTVTIDGQDYQMKNFSGVEAYGINATTEYPEIATELAMYLGSGDVQIDKYQTFGEIPALASLESVITEEPIIPVINDIFEKYSISHPTCSNMQHWWTAASNMAMEIMKGIVTHENAEKMTETFTNSVNGEYLDRVQFTVENTEDGVQLKWQSVDGAAEYIIYKMIGGAYRKIASFTDGESTDFVDTSVVPGKENWYAMKAINGNKHSFHIDKAITYGNTIDEEPIECKLTVWAPSGALKEQCDEFALSHPNWDITFDFKVWNEEDAAAKVAEDVDNAADVYCYSNDHLDSLLNANGIMALEGTEKAFVENNFGQTYIACVSKNGEIYGVPYGTNTWYMYYNKSVYTEEDVKSLDKMLEKGKVAFPITNSWYNVAFYLATGAEFFGGINDNDAGINVGGENGVKATKYMVDLVANPNFVNGEFPDVMSGLADGTVSAAFSGIWDDANAKEVLGNNYGVAALPSFEIDGQNYKMKNFSSAKAYGVNPKTEYPEVAAALAVYLGSEDAQKAYYDDRRDIPAIKRMTNVLPNEPLVPVMETIYSACSAMQPYCSNMDYWWETAQNWGFMILNGEVTHDNAEEMTETFNRAVNNLDEEPVECTLTVWTHASGQYGESEWIQEKCETFAAEHPDWDITFEFGEFDYQDNLNDILVTGTKKPDVFYMTPGELVTLLPTNCLLELNETASGFVENNFANTYIDCVSKNEKIYGVPCKPNGSWVLYYNTSIYTEEDIKSLDAMLEKGKVVLPLHIGTFIESFYLATGAEFLNYDVGTNVNGENNVKATNYLVDLVANPNFLSANLEDVINELSDGSVVAVFSWTDDMEEIQEALGDNYGVAVLPQISIDNEVYQMKEEVSVHAYGINASTDYPEIATALAMYLGSEDVQLERMEKFGKCPAINGVDDSTVQVVCDMYENYTVDGVKINQVGPGAESMAMELLTGIVTHNNVERMTKAFHNAAKWVFLDSVQFTLESTTDGVQICWDKVDGATEYLIYRRSTNGKYTEIANIIDGGTTSYIDSNVENGMEYEYVVKAMNENDYSFYESNTITYIQPEEEPEDCTLTVWTHANEQYGESEWIQEKCETFAAEHPDWDITFEFGEFDYQDNLNDILVTGTKKPDVFYMTPGELVTLLPTNCLLELNETASGFVENNFANTYIDCVSKNEKIYGVPCKPNGSWVLYYNTSIYTEEDIKSLDAMLEKGKVVLPLEEWNFIEAFYLATGSELLDYNGTGADGDNGVKATNYLVDLVSNTNFQSANLRDVKNGLSDGTVAAAFSLTYDMKWAQEALGDNYGVAVLPKITIGNEEYQMKEAVDIHAYGVNASTEYPEIATALAMYLGSEEVQVERDRLFDKCPAINGVDDPTVQVVCDMYENYTINARTINQGGPAIGNMAMEILNGIVTHDNAEQMTKAMNNTRDGVQLESVQFTLESTTDGVQISWDKVDGATEYLIYRRSTNGKYTEIANIIDGGTTSYIDSNVETGMEYEYAMKAMNENDYSFYASNTITYITMNVVPTECTLTVWAPENVQLDEAPWLQEQCEAFAAEHPEWDITFNFGVCADDDVGNVVAEDVNNAADVYCYSNYQLETLLAANGIMALTGDDKAFVEDNFGQTYIDCVSKDGAIYGVPYGMTNTCFVYYDKSVYTEEDVKSLETMLEKGKVMFPVTSPWHMGVFYLATGAEFFGGINDNDAGINVGGENGVKATKYMIDLVANPNFVNGHLSDDISVLADGTVAAAFSGIFDKEDAKLALGENFGVATLPTIEIDDKDYQMKSFSGTKAYGVNPTTEYPEIAKELAVYLGSKDAQKALYETNGNIPAISDMAMMLPNEPLVPVIEKMFSECSIVEPYCSNMDYWWTSASIFGDDLLKGNITHENAAEKTEAFNRAVNNLDEDASEITLTVWAPENVQLDEAPWLQEQCEAFAAEHPEWDITFAYGVCNEGDAGQRVSEDVDNAADVYCYSNDNLEKLLAVNGIMALTGNDKAFVEDNFGQTYIDCVSNNGNIYGVPYSSNTWFMYYNKDIYTEEDVKSLDTMLQKGKVVFPLFNSWYIEAFYLATGAEFFGGINDNDAGINVGGENGLKATNYLVDLVANPNFLNGEFGDAYAGLADGNIAAAFSGVWNSYEAKEALGDNYAVAALPKITIDGVGYQMKNFSGAKAYGVNATTEYPEVAKALAVYLGSEDAQKALYQVSGNIPVINGMATVLPNEPLVPVIEEIFANCSIMQPYCNNMGSWWTPASIFGDDLLKGNITHENAAEKTEAFNEAVNEKIEVSNEEKGPVYYLNFKPEQAEQWKTLAAVYTEETGIKVDVVTPSMGTYETTLKSEMEKEDAPTLFQVNGPVGLETWKDYCYDLSNTDLYGEVKSDDFVVKNNGQVAAIAYVIETYGIIYNKAIMADYMTKEYAVISDISELNNFAKLKAVAESIQANKEDLGVDGAFTSAGMSSSSDWRFKTHLANLPIYYEYKEDGIGYTSAIKGTYLDNYKQIWDLYINNATCDPSVLLDKEGSDAEAEFIAGDAVFFQNGEWEYWALINGGMTDDQLGMLPIYIGVEGEENQGLCTGSENYWCVNKNASQEEIEATLDFLYWCVTSDKGREAMANDMGFTTPFKAFDDGYTHDNVLKHVANEYIANGKIAITWNFPSFPSEAWKDGVGTALTAYARGTGDWEAVEKAFVEGWASEYEKWNSE